MDVIDFLVVVVICFCIVFMFVVKVGWYLIVEGICFKSVDIFEFVWVKWKILLIKNKIFWFLLWKCFVRVKFVNLICVCVLGGLFICL